MMVIDQQVGTGERLRPVGLLADKASLLIRTIAQPSFVQLVMRVALAVPFWRSGILKWDGFLQLSDTAVTLFSDEFMLHLPGGPYPYPAPTVMAFLSGSAEERHDGRCRIRVGAPRQVQHELVGKKGDSRVAQLQKSIPFEDAGAPERHGERDAHHKLDKGGLRDRADQETGLVGE